MACLYALLCEASSDSFAIYNTKYHKQKRTNCSRKSWDFTLGIYTVLCHRWRIMIRIQVIVLKKSRRFTKLRGSSGRSSGERKTALVFYEKGQGLWIQVVSPLVASVTGWLQLSLLWERTEKIKNGGIRNTSIITEVSNHWDKDILQNEFQAVIWCRFWEKNPSQTTHKNHIGVFFLPLDYGNCHVFRLPMWEKCEDTKCPQPHTSRAASPYAPCPGGHQLHCCDVLRDPRKTWDLTATVEGFRRPWGSAPSKTKQQQNKKQPKSKGSSC